jgi:hypothetical protein
MGSHVAGHVRPLLFNEGLVTRYYEAPADGWHTVGGAHADGRPTQDPDRELRQER